MQGMLDAPAKRLVLDWRRTITARGHHLFQGAVQQARHIKPPAFLPLKSDRNMHFFLDERCTETHQVVCDYGILSLDLVLYRTLHELNCYCIKCWFLKMHRALWQVWVAWEADQLLPLPGGKCLAPLRRVVDTFSSQISP